MVYSFIIKKEWENKVVNVLSYKGELRETTGSLVALIAFPTSDWTCELKSSYAIDSKMAELMLKLKSKLEVPKNFTIQQKIIL